jgi:uncharacterized protein (DUF1330 family)
MIAMPKGYWIAHVTVKDPELYKEYVALNGIAFAKYGAKFLVRGGTHENVRGLAGRNRHVVIEFADLATAKACHDSPEYRKAAAVRDSGADVDLTIVEGYDG